jgi:DNA-binding NarL/FixJ family response regulator
VERGVVSLSVDLLRAATALPRTGGNLAAVTDDEMAWLRALGQGTTVASLAESVGLSERVMYRRLGRLYRRLGVPGRTQALMRGRDEGWL